MYKPSDTTKIDTVERKAESKWVKPTGEKPEWAPNIHPEMQAVIEKLASYNAPPVETLSAAEARKTPTPAQAVMDLIKENNIQVPQLKVDTVRKNIPVKGGQYSSSHLYPAKADG